MNGTKSKQKPTERSIIGGKENSMNLLSKNFKALPKVLVFLGCLGIVLSFHGVPEADSHPPSAGTLFGFAVIDGENRLVIVDPETGELTIAGSIPGSLGAPQGISALDPVNHRYFFPKDGRLVSVDTQTGAVIAYPLLSVSPTSLEFELFMVQEVAIDIKPGSFPNSINPKSRGRIPVAILTTDTFDATTVDPTTVRFGPTGTEAAPVQSAFEDVNGDLETDMIFHFQTQVTGIACGDTKASLTGETFDRQMIQGADSIKTVGCK